MNGELTTLDPSSGSYHVQKIRKRDSKRRNLQHPSRRKGGKQKLSRQRQRQHLLHLSVLPALQVSSAVSEWTPEEGQFGKFLIKVSNEWRHLKGFRVYEADKNSDVQDNVRTFEGWNQRGSPLREWYCAKEIEPEGGFKDGEQRIAHGAGGSKYDED
eukprot:747001-Hanusia_phi.AAC.2